MAPRQRNAKDHDQLELSRTSEPSPSLVIAASGAPRSQTRPSAHRVDDLLRVYRARQTRIARIRLPVRGTFSAARPRRPDICSCAASPVVSPPCSEFTATSNTNRAVLIKSLAADQGAEPCVLAHGGSYTSQEGHLTNIAYEMRFPLLKYPSWTGVAREKSQGGVAYQAVGDRVILWRFSSSSWPGSSQPRAWLKSEAIFA